MEDEWQHSRFTTAQYRLSASMNLLVHFHLIVSMHCVVQFNRFQTITFRFTAKIQNYFPNDHDRRLTHNISIHWYSIFEARSKFKLISRFVFVFMFVYATRSYLSTHQNRQFCMHICTVSIKSFYFEFSYFWWIVFCILYFVLLCVFKHTSITNACFDWL